MSKYISHIPLTDISRIQLYINQSRKTLAQIKAETGADYLLNGGVYSGTKAVMHLRAGGTPTRRTHTATGGMSGTRGLISLWSWCPAARPTTSTAWS